ncbi:MAG: sugar ABC transporter ATP-binding protein [Actinomycetaceae bacterium]|nr:sugar ABC transporter ATP-binding protein [Actinomycetaceae bacterium]
MTTLQLKHIYKSFGPVDVLKDISLTVKPGKVHVLLGENGAGKSTLIKIIAGIHAADKGEILLDGETVKINGVKDAEERGISVIHQELNLVPKMSIAENLMLGKLPTRFGVVDRRKMLEKARAALEMVGLEVSLDQPVGELGIAGQQLVEIAKALSQDSQIIVLDEPTAALTTKEIEILFDLMRKLKQRGVAMIFISHHLNELAEIGDTVSVLRDGNLVAEVDAKTPEAELVKLMVGRPIDQQFPPRKVQKGPTVLEVKNLTSVRKFKDISFNVHEGEVLGIAGLVGAGRTEVLRAISGADHYDSGTVNYRGTALKTAEISKKIGLGVGLVPEDRKGQGLVLGASVTENLTYSTLLPSSKMGIVPRQKLASEADEVAKKLKVRMGNASQKVKELSGGNQQKIVFGRWVMSGAKLLLLDEPTRGVDVGAKVEIYELINNIVASGGAVVMVSSELPEILGMSDRILVMSEGRIAGELDGKSATQDEIMTLAVSNVTELTEK